jgi:hypothetical protein
LLAGGCCALFACGGSGSHTDFAASDSGASADGGGSSEDDASGSSGGDASSSTSTDSGASSLDGPATRKTCSNTFGNELSMFYGRLDGFLVSIVPEGQHSCNGDSTHVHLQILMHNGIYDVAVNTDGLEAELDHAMVGPAWSEGWSASAQLDYPTTLGIHSSAFATTNAQALEASLASANHVTIFATAYGPGGVHLVHRDLNNHDGAVVMNPLGPTPHWLVFRFSNDSF